jgi:hypothetical protein
MSETQSTPQPAPSAPKPAPAGTNAAPAVKPSEAIRAAVEALRKLLPEGSLVVYGKDINDFAVGVGRMLLDEDLLTMTTSKPGKRAGTGNKPYATFHLGTGTSDFRKRLTLTGEQSRRLVTIQGAPIDIAMSFTALDLTPVTGLSAKLQEREVNTIQRESRSVKAISDNVLLEDLNRRRIERGQQPIENFDDLL